MKIVALPGLDGTGKLFEPFASLCPERHEFHPVSLNQTPNLTITEQIPLVKSAMGDEPCLLLAESYSGMLAYEVALAAESNISHILFVASFLRSPSVLSKYAANLPTGILENSFIIKSIGARIAFRQWHSQYLSDLLVSAVNSAGGETLNSRLKEISKFSSPTERVDLPCTYIQATADNLVSNELAEDFEQLFSSFELLRINGSHFLLQTNPSEAWAIIDEIIE